MDPVEDLCGGEREQACEVFEVDDNGEIVQESQDEDGQQWFEEQKARMNDPSDGSVNSAVREAVMEQFMVNEARTPTDFGEQN